MRILHVLPSLEPGGMEQLVIQLAADAARHGDEVAVAAGPGVWTRRVLDVGAELIALPATSRSGAGLSTAAARLTRGIRRMRPQVVHSHNVRSTALARLALTAAHHDATLVPTLHGLAPDDYRAASRILRLAADRVIACAPSVADSLESAGFPRHRIEVIVNGAALQPAGHHREEQLRTALQIGPARLVVGIGRLVPQKNWRVLVTAASRVDGACCVVAGDGPLRRQLTDLASAAGNRVRFVGAIDDIAALIGIASCVVSTSAWEGLPLAVLEALSLGAPVVATAVGGVTDVVPPEAALLVPPEDSEAVTVAILRILNDPALAAQLRRAALIAAEAWRPERMLEQYRYAYRSARERAHAPATERSGN
jgi:glycosyltransferase involved in cell wall biosynthesis